MGKLIAGVLFILIPTFWLKVKAQNLVPNPSFEDHTSCPNGVAEVSKVIPWTDPTSASSDFFDSCSIQPNYSGVPSNIGGYQLAHTGSAYLGFGAYGGNEREYIQVKLTDSLTTGVIYRVSFYISPTDSLKYGSDGIGAYFSKDAITCTPAGCLLNYNPQVSNPVGNIITDMVGWTEINGTFTAVGGEIYLTIGNFKDDANTQFSVINSTSTYESAYFYIDDVSVYPDSVTGINELKWDNEFNLFPNPNNGSMQLNYKIKSGSKGSLVIYDVTGKEVNKYMLQDGKNNLLITESNLQNGIYFYKALVNEIPVKTGKVVIVK